MSDPLAAVREAEGAIRPRLADRLRAEAGADPARADALRAWADQPGTGDESAVYRAAAREAVVLTNAVRYRVAAGTDIPPDLRETPVPPFRGLAATDEVEGVLDDLGERLAGRTDDVGDLLGAGYADVLPDEERRTLGQYYTPAPVADLVTRWALEGSGDRPRVLDPAAGTGAFPLAVARALDEGPDDGPEAAHLTAVDVDGVALHLAALRLAARGRRPAVDLDRRRASVFDLEPGADVEPVDAVVGNPPFVRAGDLAPDGDHFRAHLADLGPAGESPYADGDRALSRRCDASVYFVTHATRFLRPGGRLGVVLPAKWLESGYGVGFRRFLADHYDVRAVVGFGARAFDALVDTVLLLAERRADGVADPDGSEVRFVRLDGRPDAVTSLGRLADGPGDDPSAGAAGPPGRVVRRPQRTFAGARQCSPYLRAPAELLELLAHPDFVPLSELASVRRGVTTGANRFFLLDADDRDRWGVDGRCLRPALRSVRGFEARTLAADDVEQSVLDVHGVLAALTGGTGPDAPDPTAHAKDALRAAGYHGVVDYVEHAESAGWHEGRTCRSRRVWFDLGALPTPDAFVPKLVRERVFTVRNRARAVPTNAIDCLDVRDGVDPDLLLGVLDSSLCRALMEVWGRDEAGLLQLMTDETRTLPVPDVRAFPAPATRAVVEAAGGLAVEAADRPARGQRALDAAVGEAVDVDLAPGRVRELREALVRRRVDGGERVEVPVS